MCLNFRFGQPEDIDIVAGFILEAGGGFFEFLLEQVVPDTTVRELLKFAVSDSESVLHYGNALLAVEDGTPVGMLLGYPSEDYGIPLVVESIVPKLRIDHVRGILTTNVADSWYINSLVVSSSAQGKGIGRSLLELSSAFAAERGFSEVSLHVWGDNEPALRIYRTVGFTVVDTVDVLPARHLQHAQGMLLIKAPLPLTLTS